MKILYVATVRSHVGQFHVDYLKKLKELGAEIHAAYRDNSEDKPGLDLSAIDEVFEIPFQRSPFKADNIKAYFKLKKVIDSGHYDLVHCHTPVGGIITRLAARNARKKGTKVVYTAHGFHFFNGASKKNWLLYYPIEKFFSRFADAIITINNEDYKRAKKFKCKNVFLVHGVGVDINIFHIHTDEEIKQLREEYNLNGKYIMIYPANLDSNKNQTMVINMAAEIKKNCPDLGFVILMPGQPILKERLENMAEVKGVSENCIFMGYRRDIDKLVGLSDVMISASKREGLPVCIMEAMATGKPIVCTNVRGNNDLVAPNMNGYLCEIDDFEAMAEYVIKLYRNKELRIEMGLYGRKMIENEYCTEAINFKLLNIYKGLIDNDLK